VKAPGNLHAGVWPNQPEMRLWYKLKDQEWGSYDRKRVDEVHLLEKRQEDLSWEMGEIITELDVVYGDDEPFFGFERVEGGKVLERKEGKWDSVDLAYRRGSYGELYTLGMCTPSS
jgi:hypothetical protein